ncbi:MAG: hypothetical protein KFB93_06750 [Simkaniaceae bacterium]|nr:MAG: hypothetical protein KFB93_06750 [Simkaniaceae bacterium]
MALLVVNVKTMKKLIIALLPFAAFANISDVIGHYTPIEPTPPPSTIQAIETPSQIDKNLCEITATYSPLANNSVDIIVDVEFLWWYSNVTNLSYGTKRNVIPIESQVAQNSTMLAATKKQEFNRKWNPAFRIGFGIAGFQDGWDLYSNWTYYHSHESTSKSVAPLSGGTLQSVGTEVYTSSWLPGPNDITFSKLSAHLQLLYNQFDLTLGRKFWISTALGLHPYMGLRGFYSQLFFRLKGTRPDHNTATVTDFRQSTQAKQKLYGVGLLAGTDANWHFHTNWSIITSGAVSLTYGKYQVTTRLDSIGLFDNSGNIAVESHSKTPDNTYGVQTFIDCAIGLSWEDTYYQKAIRLKFDAAWETQLKIDYHRLHWPNVYYDYPGINGNLVLSGLVLRGRIDF